MCGRHVVDGQGVDVVLLSHLQVVAEGDGLSVVAPLEGRLRGSGDDGLELDGLADLADGGGQGFDDDGRGLGRELDFNLRGHVEDQSVVGLALPVPSGDLVGTGVLLLDVGDLDDGAVHVHVGLVLDGHSLALLQLHLVVEPLDVSFGNGNEPRKVDEKIPLLVLMILTKLFV